MLSKLLHSARNIVNLKPNQRKVDDPTDSDCPSPWTMVTTRRQSGAILASSQETGSVSADDIPYELLSASARKRRRAQLSGRVAAETDQLDSPSVKRQKLPLRRKDTEEQEVNPNIAVVIPSSQVLEERPPSSSSKASNKGRKGKRETVEESITNEGTVPQGKENNTAEVECAPATPVGVGRKTRASLGASKPKDSPKASPKPVVTEAQPEVTKPKHKKFGDDEPAEVLPIVVSEPEIAEEDEDDESSDDDAPEEVGAQSAQQKAVDAAREAAKAAEKQESAIRQKRRERDAQLKNQAKKRKHIEAEEEEAKVEGVEMEESTSKTQKFDRHNLPDFLPEEFLEDEVKDDIEIESDDEAPRKNKKTKFFLEEKKPKDKKRGSTTYRVAEARQDRLAPKLSKNAQAMKESLMGSRKGQVRKSMSSGFLRK